MNLKQRIYRLFVNLKQKTSRLFCLIIASLAALLALNPSAYAARAYVDGSVAACDNDGDSWSEAFKYLQDALDFASDPANNVTEIWVAGTATYYPDEDCANPGGANDEALSFEMIAGVEVYGGFAGGELNLEDRDIFANPTILSGEIDTAAQDDNSRHVVSFLSLSGNAAVLDGFTVRDGYTLPDALGAGILVNSSDNVIIRNCILLDNEAVTGGGLGVIATSAGDVLEVRNCLFEDNSAVFGGGIGAKSADGDINVINCYFSANDAAFGGGAYSSQVPFTFINTTFTENTASTPLNQGQGGAVYFTFAVDALFVNSLFLYNTADNDGGAVYIGGLNGTIEFDNCTLSKNHADDEGGGILARNSSTVTITNCIVWGNTDGDVDTTLEEAQILDSGATVNVSYTCVEGLNDYTGSGNIGVDPTFVDEDGSNSSAFDSDDNFRLFYGSPCIDAADNDAVDADDFDVDENLNDTEDTPDLDFADRRIDDLDTTDTGNGTPPLVDMGAYEFGPCPWDLDGNCEVGAGDLLLLLADWGNPYGAFELLALLADWGPCPCDPMAVVLSLEEEWEDACLTEAQWDEYVDVMADPDSSQADKDRYDCWMTHYLLHCNNCTCEHRDHCPNPDPFN